VKKKSSRCSNELEIEFKKCILTCVEAMRKDEHLIIVHANKET